MCLCELTHCASQRTTARASSASAVAVEESEEMTVSRTRENTTFRNQILAKLSYGGFVMNRNGFFD